MPQLSVVGPSLGEEGMNETIRVWITKYALTQGIYEVEVTECDNGMVSQKPQKGSLCNMNSYYHGEGREWHRTREGAVAKAEAMRKKKIAAIRKQLLKLEAMKF